MLLRELIKAIEPLKFEGSLERRVTGITYDSRRVLPGMAFVAVIGNRADGHSFIIDAIDRGAVAIVCEKDDFVLPSVTKIVVKNSRRALALLSEKFYDSPSKKLKVIGVTGTNGKTTVTFMLKAILEAAGIKTGLLGTVHYEIGDRIIPASRTTPESLEIQKMMAEMLNNSCKACVMEVSSHSLVQDRVLGVDFDFCIFTNLTRDHLDYHHDFENYYQAKRKLFLPEFPYSKPTAAIINIDDNYGQRLAGECRLSVLVTYGINKSAEINASEIKLMSSGTELTLSYQSLKKRIFIPLVGRHNVYNALAAISTALIMGLDINIIEHAIANMPAVPGRLEHVNCGQDFTVLVDYAHTDDALYNVLSALREVTSGRIITVFGCGGNRDASKRPKMGAVAAKYSDYTIITTDNPRKERAEDIALQIKSGYEEVRSGGYEIELDRKLAIETALKMAKTGDTVLIAGKGHETYQEFEDTIIPFDDRLYAENVLKILAGSTAKPGKGLKKKSKLEIQWT